jgi:hypothetical protein
MLKSRLIVFAVTVISALSAAAQGDIFIWTEIDPGWKNQSLEHWASVKGYGKSIPLEMSELISEYHSLAEKKFELSLRENLISSELPKTTVFTTNPGRYTLKEDDLYLDIQCNIVEISEVYPNFRINKINITPSVKYAVSLYDAAGKKISEKVYLDSIDYKTKIRPLLRGKSEHRRDVEIVRYSFIESFSGQIPRQLLSEVTNLINEHKNKAVVSDPEKFKTVLGLVFENRKLQHPLDYKEIDFTKHSSPINTGSRKRIQSDPTYADSEIAERLGELIEGSKYYALIIGVNDYSDPSINDLEEPLHDARELYATLTNHYTFYEENITLLENPSRDQLIHSLDKLAYELTENDNLLVFYAGHGLWDEQLKKGFWIPADANSDNRANWFSNSDLRDYIGGIRAKHTLLISDACFSGGIFKTRTAFRDITPAMLELYKLPSRKAMTSGAMTTVPDKSVFIEYLIKRLNENEITFLSSEQLFASFKIAVINNSSTNQVPQFGEIRETGDEGGDFLFIRKINKEEVK